MEMELRISLTVMIDEKGSNLIEICAAVQETVRGELARQVAEEVIEGFQEDLRTRLYTRSGRKAKKGLGGQKVTKKPERRCRVRTFVK